MDSLLKFLPYITLILSFYSFYRGYKQWISGTTITNVPRNGGQVTRTDTKERQSWLSIGANWFGIILFVGSIVWIIALHSDK